MRTSSVDFDQAQGDEIAAGERILRAAEDHLYRSANYQLHNRTIGDVLAIDLLSHLRGMDWGELTEANQNRHLYNSAEQQERDRQAAWQHEELLAGCPFAHSRFIDSGGTPRRWTYNGDGTMRKVREEESPFRQHHPSCSYLKTGKEQGPHDCGPEEKTGPDGLFPALS